LPDDVEAAIEAEMDRPQVCVESKDLGRARRLDDAGGRYVEFCKSTFPNELDLRGLKIVVDCAHGAGYHVAPEVFHELGAEVTAIGASPDGLNINDGVGAVHTESIAEAVRSHRADIGVALDGDADRVVMVDSAGEVFNGDQLLYVIVRDRISRERPGTALGAVGTLMTNFALERRFGEMGVPFARAKVGDRYVLEMLQEKGWLWGGEGSGHLLCLDKHTTGDGIISALQVLAAVRHAGKTLSELTADLRLMPQKLLNVRVAQGFDWKNHEALKRETVAVEQELGGSGRVLIRPSGTEPVLRLMVEADDAVVADEMARRLAASVGR
jgi:phosphoglucosamine mutase